MATIEERKQQLENKLKKMAEDNVVVKPVTIPNSFDPSEDTESSPATSGEEDNNLEETKETKTAKEKPVDETEREETGNTEQKRVRCNCIFFLFGQPLLKFILILGYIHSCPFM